jgi:hypothetical protein
MSPDEQPLFDRLKLLGHGEGAGQTAIFLFSITAAHGSKWSYHSNTCPYLPWNFYLFVSFSDC